MADKRLVIAIFETEAAADEAAERLKVTRVVVGDAIAVLVLDERGELKTNKIGATSGGKGATAGLVLGLLGPVGLGVGVVGGALAGKLHHKDLGLDDADRERLGADLRGGKAAVGVLASRTSSSPWSPSSSGTAARWRRTSSTRRDCARPPRARTPDPHQLRPSLKRLAPQSIPCA